MQRARALEGHRQAADGRGADVRAPRPTPLTLVAGAVAGADLASVADTVAAALGCPVAIVIPALGEPVIRPPDSVASEAAGMLAAHAQAVCRGQAGPRPAPAPLADAVAVLIGDAPVGIVGAGATAALDGEDRHAWLEAAAQAAAVTALIAQTSAGASEGSAEALITELIAGPPSDIPALLVRARRLGLDLSAGAVAICARAAGNGHPAPGDGRPAEAPLDLRRLPARLSPAAPPPMAEVVAGRLVALAPVAGEDDPAGELAAALREAGLAVGDSAPRRDPRLLHEAVREAELLAELGRPDTPPPGQDETYRLLIGVLLRDPAELRELQDTTITPLAEYDARHDTELLATLRAFLAHDGSTTETADAMKLHRHTVGYRLARVQEVAGLSPYESDGRERLSLGIKARQILDAERRLSEAAGAPRSAPLTH